MKFPSLFRIPKHQQFEIKPRYYDPVKEFVKEREELAKSGDLNPDSRKTTIRFKRRKSVKNMNVALLQFVIALLLSSFVVGWLYFGNNFLYLSFLLIPLYLYFRFRRR